MVHPVAAFGLRTFMHAEIEAPNRTYFDFFTTSSGAATRSKIEPRPTHPPHPRMGTLGVF